MSDKHTVTLATTESGRFSRVTAITLLGKNMTYNNKKAEAATEFTLKINGTPGLQK
jgi:hypothetical protein